MTEAWQEIQGLLTAAWVANVAQVAAAVFVGIALWRDAKARELEAFFRLQDRWNTIGDTWRLQKIQERPLEEQRPYVWLLFSFAELVAMLINARRLRDWRLRNHFSVVLEQTEEWLGHPMFSDRRHDPKYLPEFKELRRQEKLREQGK